MVCLKPVDSKTLLFIYTRLKAHCSTCVQPPQNQTFNFETKCLEIDQHGTNTDASNDTVSGA